MNSGKKTNFFRTAGTTSVWAGTTFGGEALYSEDCPEAPVGSLNLWFDAMAALAHPTNYSGAFAAYLAPQRPVRKKFVFFQNSYQYP